jgi:hypothetical protein
VSWLTPDWVNAVAEHDGVSPDIVALTLYTGDIASGDERFWCRCGDEIILPARWFDEPVWYGPDGQYCCWICAETTYSQLALKEVER